MNVKELRLDVEALVSQVVYGHGFLHYGYWPDGESTSSLEALGRAQQCYFDKLAATLPPDVTSILDVGSGTGSNAASLLNRGYAVDCVCPSEKLNQLARKKLPASTRIFECRFEDFSSDGRYDALIFCESFHYLDAERALEQAARYAGRYVLIFDYFRRSDADGRDRVSHAQFRSLLANRFSPLFDVVQDDDVTDFVAPTFRVLDDINNNYVKPFANRVISDFRSQHPWYALLFSRLLGRLTRSAGKTSDRHRKFAERHEYRLILLRRAG